MPYIGRGPQQSGAFRILDDVSGSFNGSTTSFALTVGSAALTVGLPETLLIAVDGVIQEAGSAYTISGSNIVFGSAPQAAATFWGVELGDVGGLADRATTQSASDNSTKIATTAYVDAQVATEDTLAEMGDVNLTTPGDAAILVYDTATSTWRDAAVSGDATIGDTGVITLAAAIDATKIADGSVTSTEFQYINTLSSNAQTQITAKAAVGSATPSTQAFSDSAVSGSSAEAARVDHKHAMMVSPSGVPSGLIAYMAGSCPSGWTEYTAARGRYVVGVPSGGTVAGTQGTALTNQENRAVGQHTHTFSGSAMSDHNHTQNAHNHSQVGKSNSGNGTTICGSISGANPTTTTGSTTATNIAASAGTPAGTNANAGSVANTNAPYIQLTVCQKD